jgi:hypothetical protein
MYQGFSQQSFITDIITNVFEMNRACCCDDRCGNVESAPSSVARVE